MKNFKEKQLLVKWSRAMNEPIDTALVEEVERYEQIQRDIIESVKQNTIKDLRDASIVVNEIIEKVVEYPKPPTIDELLNVITEETESVTTSEPSLVNLAVEHITKEVKLEEKADSFQQPEVSPSVQNIKDINRKLKFIEEWVAKISITGPGGGAGSVARLDHETTLITSSNYTITSKDYYVGINYSGNVTIELPTITNSGRVYVIKDESGNCSLNPITVLGNVDNDPGGFILAQNNGGIQLIYRNGWRII